MKGSISVIAAVLCAMAGSAAAQPASSPLRSNLFVNCFGGTHPNDRDAPRSIVLTRGPSGSDAGCDFGSQQPLDARHTRLVVVPSAAINGGYYVLTILFFGTDGRFMREVQWVADTNSLEPRRLEDVRRFASEKGITAAATYLLRIRVQPHVYSGSPPAFGFTRISIGPAPAARRGGK